MKASNKVLIVFFGVILLYISAAFTEVRIRGVKEGLNSENAKVETRALDDLKYLKLSDLDSRVLIRSSDDPRIEIRSRSEGLLSNLKYTLEGDTLNISEFEVADNINYVLTLHVPKSLTGINVYETSVHISQLDQASLSLIQSGGRVVFDENVTLDKLSISTQEDADLDAYDFEVDTLILDIDDSDIYIQSPINRLQGSMKNRSNLVMGSVNDIQFNKDESSELRLFN